MGEELTPPAEEPSSPASAQDGPSARNEVRAENVAFASGLLESEISNRNARKDTQENTARGLVVTAGLVLTLLLGLASGAGLFSAKTSLVARVALIVTVLFAAGAAGCAIGVLWPRTYGRLGKDALNEFNQTNFLDRPPDEVAGRVVAARISLATTMDTQHENKAKWLKAAFYFLAGAFVALVVQVVVLVIDPPSPKASAPVRILELRRYGP
jgi:hypothetical protein